MYVLHKQTLQHPTQPLLQIEFEAVEEYGDPTNQFQGTIDVEWIIKQQAMGNHASWFNARIYVRLSGSDVKSKDQWLGCCSYKSFDEFLNYEESAYYHDMVRDATRDFFDTIDGKIQSLKSTLNMLDNLKHAPRD